VDCRKRTKQSGSCESCVSTLIIALSLLLALLTKTKDDRVYTNNDSRAIARETPLAPDPPNDYQQSRFIVVLKAFSYIPIGKKCATPPNTMKAPAAKLTMRLQGEVGSVCDRGGWVFAGASRRDTRVVLTMHRRSP
jgi:hypothetical protein